jgi:hypothetical protein
LVTEGFEIAICGKRPTEPPHSPCASQ